MTMAESKLLLKVAGDLRNLADSVAAIAETMPDSPSPEQAVKLEQVAGGVGVQKPQR